MSGLRLCRAGPGPWSMRPGKSPLALTGSPTWEVRTVTVYVEADLEKERRLTVREKKVPVLEHRHEHCDPSAARLKATTL